MSENDLITAEMIRECDPDGDYLEDQFLKLIGKGKTALEVLDLPMSVKNRIWILMLPGCLPGRVQHEVVVRCAEDILQYWDQRYSDDDRPRKAIETKRRWLRGAATDEELSYAMAAAMDAANYVLDKALESDCDGIESLAHAAAMSAVYATSKYAMLDIISAGRQRTIDILKELISDEKTG